MVDLQLHIPEVATARILQVEECRMGRYEIELCKNWTLKTDYFINVKTHMIPGWNDRRLPHKTTQLATQLSQN